jgi:hypothetical protein
MKEKDNSKSSLFLIKKNSEKIAKDIDYSFEKKVKEHRLILAMYDTKETKLNYLNSEKSKLIKSIKESSYNSKRGLDNYLEYLSRDPYDNFLREDAIIFVIRDVFLEDVEEVEDLLNTVFKNYTGYNREGPIKAYVQRATLLEYNFFLTNELNKISEEETIKNKDYLKKTTHPFIDNEMLVVFNHIMDKWDYEKDIKYAYIFNELLPEGHNPSNYEKWVRNNYKQIIKFNYNNAISAKTIQSLRQIIKSK